MKRRDRRWPSLLHGLLVLLVCTDIFTGLFALFAPLALFVFVPSVAVTLLTVVPPPAAAAEGKEKEECVKTAEGVRSGEIINQQESKGQM